MPLIIITSKSTKDLVSIPEGCVLIHPNDFTIVANLNWNTTVDGYVRGRVNRQAVFIHRVILNASIEQIIDHKNQNKLDNRRCNLRIATKALNRINSNKTKGYSYVKNKFWAQIQVEGKSIDLGTYPTKEWARKAYLQARKQFYGV